MEAGFRPVTGLMWMSESIAYFRLRMAPATSSMTVQAVYRKFYSEPGQELGMIGAEIAVFMNTIRKAVLNITTAEWVGLASRTDPPDAKERFWPVWMRWHWTAMPLSIFCTRISSWGSTIRMIETVRFINISNSVQNMAADCSMKEK